MVDKDMIIRALRLWFQPGDVFEVRVLEATMAGYRSPHTEYGYFEYDAIPRVAEELAKVTSYAGCYATLNPVDEGCFPRAANRLKPAQRGATTTDADIVRRRWLPIDCDPDRKSGTCSTEEEHLEAIGLARDIRDGLTGLGWPLPLLLDSGNGAQMLYRVDLPADDGGLVKGVLDWCATAPGEHVHIDASVSNPARIWRIPGTWNCKGDSTRKRPHRLAQILEEPPEFGVVPEEILRKVLPRAEEKSACAVPEPSPCASFDADGWLALHCPGIGPAEPYNGGRRWLLPVCPFDESHRNCSCVIQEPSGAMAFTCRHNSCRDRHWRDFRLLYEPDCYDMPLPAADIVIRPGGNLRPGDAGREQETEQDTEEKLFPNPGPLPENLLSIPGFVDDVAALTMSSAPYPNRVLAFTGALALLAFLSGRKVSDRRDNRSNVYLVALADSGTGKDHPRKVNFNIAFQAGLGGAVGDAFASGEGLEDAMLMHPSMLFQADEVDCIFNVMKYGRDARAESINEKLLKFYSTANSIYPIRKRALPRGKAGDVPEISQIVNPNLVIFGTAVPQYFYEALSRRVLENGLSARCLIVEAGKRGKAGNPQPIVVPESILLAARHLNDLGMSQGNLTSVFPSVAILEEDDEATSKLLEVRDECDALVEFFDDRNEITAKALWSRAFEKVCKLALLHGMSGDVYHPRIGARSVRWAWRFVSHLTRRMLYMAESYVYDSHFDERCKKVVRLIREAGGSIKHRDLLRKSKESSDEFKRLIITLEENGTLTHTLEQSGTRMGTVYHLR